MVADPHYIDADPDYVHADPDPYFNLDADLDLTYHFDADLDPTLHQRVANLRSRVYLRILHGSFSSLYASILCLHSSMIFPLQTLSATLPACGVGAWSPLPLPLTPNLPPQTLSVSLPVCE
jgi:hypothetical protein